MLGPSMSADQAVLLGRCCGDLAIRAGRFAVNRHGVSLDGSSCLAARLCPRRPKGHPGPRLDRATEASTVEASPDRRTRAPTAPSTGRSTVAGAAGRDARRVTHTVFSVAGYAAALIGTFVFALLGARVAVRRNLNTVAVVACAGLSALGGGLVRDVVIGAPPNALHRLDYVGAAAAGAVAVLLLRRRVRCDAVAVRLGNAGALSLFAVLGAERAFSYGMGPVAAALLGVVSAVGGGVLRDVLSGHAPVLFRVDRSIETVPVLLAAAVAAGLLHGGLFQPWTAAAVVLGGFLLRLCVAESGMLKQLRPRTGARAAARSV
jgi:uncharacterized membrane protein YeiH